MKRGHTLKSYDNETLKRLQSVELEVLDVTADVCEKLGLQWFLDSGTCLGARRHGGFIPWDDDIDIGMAWDDYLRFCTEAPAVLPAGYTLATPITSRNYPPLWAKVMKDGTRFMSDQMMEAGFEQGIFVDVFGYFRLDSNQSKADEQIKEAARCQKTSYLYHLAHPKVPNTPIQPLMKAGCVVAHGALRLFSSEEKIRKRLRACIDSGDGQGPYCNAFYSEFGTFEPDVLFETKPLMFEGRSFPVPHDVESYLTTMYGDWRKLPPEDERHPSHAAVLEL